MTKMDAKKRIAELIENQIIFDDEEDAVEISICLTPKDAKQIVKWLNADAVKGAKTNENMVKRKSDQTSENL